MSALLAIGLTLTCCLAVALVEDVVHGRRTDRRRAIPPCGRCGQRHIDPLPYLTPEEEE
ncbi:hypothetical protein [Streptomyces sp. CB03911]|uniref:hypothetical protein n=1 Tax=Streptomyces sp. CB03911 TaxID=1804758 RepID=UPI0018FE2521|nr:hypothetical protein [Streptomyces sp. CB03911]